MDDKLIKEHSFYKYADEVTKICKPLFDQTPVNYFCLARNYKNHDYGGLLSDKHWAYFYLKNDFHLLGAEPQLASLGENPLFWNFSTFQPTCEKSTKLFEACVNFKRACGVMFIEDNHDYKELALFSTSHILKENDPYLIKNVNMLKKFILFFKEKIHKDKKLIQGLEARHQNITQKNDVLNVENLPPVDFKIQKYYLGGAFRDIPFSRREAECLKYLYYGKSAKEIAKILQLSPRTIETYINNIKSKTHINSLQEILSKLENCFLLDAV